MNNYYIELNVHGEKHKAIPYLAIPYFKKFQIKDRKEFYFVGESNFQDLIPLTQYLSHPEEICAEHFAFYFTGRCITNNKSTINSEFNTKLEELLKEYDIIN